MKKPLVSIVLATNDSVSDINISLKSLLDQNYQNIEIIIADYGKKGKGMESTKKYQYFHIPGSFANGMNEAIKKAEGEYLLLLGPNQEAHESWTRKAIGEFDRLKVDVLRCATMYSDGRIEMPLERNKWVKQLNSEINIELPSVIFKRELAGKFSGQNVNIAQWEFWSSTVRGAKVHTLVDFVASFVPSEDNIMFDESKSFLKGALKIMEDNKKFIKNPITKLIHQAKIKKVAKKLEEGN